ncbi:CopG family transcriptional regulator [Haloferula rosea]|uniref:CopG family transcriptional regulator n=2 Tax=Haloferula rosea TaxID=490093 RepID=A0A934RD28_9BACT|nr:CopG family transcriptional regulator [Haloferula rosea]
MPQKPTTTPSGATESTRITVTLPREDYEQVCRIAQSKRVSASWVVRDAVTEYLQLDIPLLGRVESSTSSNSDQR